ncbi:hypothetical protein [Nocardia gipuzkoensis]|uniref:hypothetical protein n=1 Tax=Nocardia gipuzkoensis TaxID=2749991 RepID=UPI003EDFAC41
MLTHDRLLRAESGLLLPPSVVPPVQRDPRLGLGRGLGNDYVLRSAAPPMLRPRLRRQPDDRATDKPGEQKSTDFGKITMEFDGADLIVFGDGREIFRYSGQSGRPVPLSDKDAKECGADPVTDSYMNDKRFVGIKDRGPIPEGTYVFAGAQIETFDLGERLRLLLGGVGGQQNVVVGGRRIHAGDWGTGRVALRPRGKLRPGPCGDTNERKDFFLHGGILAGSSGCIDIGNRGFDRVVEFLAGDPRPVTVTVEYKRPAPSVKFFTGLSGAIAYGNVRIVQGPGLRLGAESTQTGTRGVLAAGYELVLQWAGGALAAGMRVDIPFSDKEAFVRAGLTGGLDFRVFGPLFGRLSGGYSWDFTGAARTQGAEAGAALRLDLNRFQLEAIYNVLRPAADDQRVHQALIGLGFKFGR